MKRFYTIIIILLVLLPNLLSSQSCNKVIQSNYGGSASDIAYDIVSAGNGQFYTVGNTNSFSAGGTDILVIKMDAAKNILWSKTYGVAGNETIRKATASPDGGLLITGQTTSFNNPRGDILCLKIDNSGNIKWVRTFGVGSTNGDLGSEIIQTADGGFAITGILDVAGLVADGVAIKLDASANLVWSKRYNSSIGEDGSGIIEVGAKLVVTSDIEKQSGNDYGLNITEFQTSNGNVLLSKNIISPNKGIFRPLIYKDFSDGYWISGHLIEGSSYSQMEQIILKLTSNYSISKTYKIARSPLTNYYYTGFAPLKSGGFITCASEPNNAGGKGHIYKINGDGSVVFARRISTSGKNSLNALSLINNKVLAAGSENSLGNDNYYLAEFDTTGIGSSVCNVDTSIISVQNHPFAVTDYVWSSIIDQPFNNIVRSLNAINQAIKIDTICSEKGSNADFFYTQDDCNPFKFKFFGSASSGKTNWDFGDGTPKEVQQTIEHFYSNAGTYKVSYEQNGSCAAVVTKHINVAIVVSDLIKNADTLICKSGNVQLRGDSAISYCWSPSTYLNSTSIVNPIAKPLNDITYRLISKTIDKNLALNGDFNEGNKGFTSEYTYSTTGVPEGVYFVGTSPYLWHPGMPACKDHTSGNGNMLLVNGATQPGKQVWKQTVAVTSNVTYEFACWAQNITFENPSKLQFSINGTPIGPIFQVNDNFCVWERFFATWNSGNSNTAEILLLNMNDKPSGNDFALDDISFAAVTYKTDSIKIVIDKPVVKASNDTALCTNGNFQMNAVGAAKYSWYPAKGLNNPSIANPIATIKDSAVQYIVTGTNVNGCNATDTVNIILLQKPVVKLYGDTAICGEGNIQLRASGGTKYQWIPSDNLDNPNIYNPIASISVNTKYFVSVTGANGCFAVDSISITVLPALNAGISNDTLVCAGNKVQLKATGGTTYRWLPANTLNDNSLSNPVASPSNSTIYTVTITGANGCVVEKTVSVNVLALPVIKLTKDTIVCRLGSVQLSASGGVVYYWSPATGLNNINSSTPIASIQSTIRYHVVVADENNCMSTDSVLIVAHPQPQFGVVIPDDSVCAGTSVHLKAFGGDSYQWTPVDGLTDPTASEPLTVLQSSSTYTVKITESVCKEQASFTIPVVIKQLQPIVVTKSNDITCNNPSAILNSNIVANTYLWSPSASLSNPTIESPVASPTSNTIYTLTIRDTAGCISSGSIEVKVLNNADFKLYQMPTAFTPGGDGKNDCFGVSKWGTLNIIYFLIYNRWGQLVFKGTDSKACWDGTFRGQVQSSGNYVYKLKALTLCGVVERTGNVVLIR